MFTEGERKDMTEEQLHKLRDANKCHHFYCDEVFENLPEDEKRRDDMVTHGKACCICTGHDCWIRWDYDTLVLRNIQK